ncbi:MAG TPA: aspartate-semialdehyde dehydrogenase [Erysipelothrix sp.]|nr:aspartate-semialdehyde dehydrogenase [Erysipelothrix sp.]
MNIGIVGATGMVGLKIKEILEERKLPIDNLYLFASARSKGTVVTFNDKKLEVIELTPAVFQAYPMDVLFFAAGGYISETYIPLALKENIKVIDNSSYFRMDENVPLVVPEINGDLINAEVPLVANPNCSTTQAVLPLKVIDDLFKIKRVVYTTFQAVSGAGLKGIEDLESGVVKQFRKNISKNVIPEIDVFMPDGYTKEEHKMIEETKKILNRDDLRISATAVRVPVKNTHAISVNVECERPINLELLKEKFKNAEGIHYVEAPDYPVAEEVSGLDDVFVGRLRLDLSVEHGLNFWCVADNIRKGAATNTVQILELMMKA